VAQFGFQRGAQLRSDGLHAVVVGHRVAPALLGLYMAMSALRSSVSMSVPSRGNRLTPMLGVMRTSARQQHHGLRHGEQDARSRAVHLGLADVADTARIRNSSPPSRATRSPLAHHGAQALRHFHQQRVAEGVAQRVVDRP
jgi:hypothetical protein